jgi:hypothetical protein
MFSDSVIYSPNVARHTGSAGGFPRWPVLPLVEYSAFSVLLCAWCVMLEARFRRR